ncbi:MAG: hypothetical protein IT366_25240 [Candidatus Hydrogenedentes bacterium]|nr:hypothetical protein [Candidatus Hydrogenedentota bacterium]
MDRLSRRIVCAVFMALSAFVAVLVMAPPISIADDTPAIKVIEPDAGDLLLMGDRMKIRWKSSGDAGSHVRLELLRANGLCTVIDTKTANDGKASWTIPPHLESDVNYSVRVIALTPAHNQDTSRGKFSIMGAGMH